MDNKEIYDLAIQGLKDKITRLEEEKRSIERRYNIIDSRFDRLCNFLSNNLYHSTNLAEIKVRGENLLKEVKTPI